MSSRTATIEPLEKRMLLTVTPITLATVANLGDKLAADSAGDIFGTTTSNSSNTSSGTVFEIPFGTTTVQTLASFGPDTGSNLLGIDPQSILIDSAGNLFGTSTSQTSFTAGGETAPGYPNELADTELWELPRGSTTIQLLTTLLPGANISAVDPSDDIFGSGLVLSFEDPYAYAFRWAGGMQTQLGFDELTVVIGQTPTYAITADTAGDAFIVSSSDSGALGVNEILAGQNASTGTSNAPAFQSFIGTDLAGNLHIVNGRKAVELSPDGQTTQLSVTGSDNLYNAYAVDPAGDVYTIEGPDSLEGGSLVELPAGSTIFQTLATNDSTGMVTSLASDNSGNLFAIAGAGTILEFQGVGTIAPVITSLSTTTAYAGNHLTLDVTGTATNFVQGQTTASLGAGITIDSVNVIDPTHVEITADVATDAAVGARTLTLTTDGLVAVDPSFTIAAPALITATGPTGSLPLPIQNSVAVFTVAISTAQTSDVTVQYTTVDGTAAAGTDYVASSGTVTIPAGQTSVPVDVQILPVLTPGSNKTFSISLSDPSDNATILTGGANVTISAISSVSNPVTSAKPLTYTSSNGDIVHLALHGPGTATAYYTNGSADPADIVVTGTTAKSSFTLSTTRNKAVNIGGFDVETPLGTFSAPAATLTGNVIFDAAVSKIVLGNNEVVGNDSLQLNGSGIVTITGQALGGLSIVSRETIHALTATSFLTGSVNAPSLTSMTIKQNSGADLNISSGATAIHIAGQITDGTWTLGGALSSLKTTSTAPDWTLNVAGDIGTLVTGTLDGTVTTPATIKSISASGTFTANITANAITTLSVRGTLQSSTIHAVSSINSISVGSIASTDIFVGVASGVFSTPTAASDFSNLAGKIESFVARDKNGFSNTVIAAVNLGKVSVNGAAATEAGSVVAEHITSFAFSEKGYKTVKYSNAKSDEQVPAFAGTDFALSVL